MSTWRISFALVLLAGTLAANSSFARVELAKLSQSDVKQPPGNGFGVSAAVKGNRAVVGAPGDQRTEPEQGAVYIFEFESGAWIERAKVFNPDSEAFDVLGHSVALDGDTVVAGAPQRGTDVGSAIGVAYVFRRNDLGTPSEPGDDIWELEAKLESPDPHPGAYFGASVSVSGDTIAVGSPGDLYNVEFGSVHVFRRIQGTWAHEQHLTGPPYSLWDSFGWSVSLVGNVLGVGGPSIGVASVFRRDASGWVPDGRFTSDPYQYGAGFGFSLGIHGDHLLVTAPEFDSSPGVAEGMAFALSRSGANQWEQVQRLTQNSSTPYGEFGWTVSLDGDRALVGAPSDQSSGHPTGVAYMYLMTDGRLRQVDRLLPSDGGPGVGELDVSIDGPWAMLASNAWGVYVFSTAGESSDLRTVASFQNCFADADPELSECPEFDSDGDGVVELSDYETLRNTLGGP